MVSRFSVEKLFSHRTRKLSRGTILSFINFRVSKMIMESRGGGKGGRFTTFRRNFVVSRYRKTSLRKPSEF